MTSRRLGTAFSSSASVESTRGSSCGINGSSIGRGTRRDDCVLSELKLPGFAVFARNFNFGVCPGKFTQTVNHFPLRPWPYPPDRRSAGDNFSFGTNLVDIGFGSPKNDTVFDQCFWLLR